MSTAPHASRDHPAVRNYSALCLAALMVLFLVLLDRNLGAWSLLPVLIGGAALALNWSTGPALVLLCAGGLIVGHDRSQSEEMRLNLSPVSDLALCLAVAAYLAGSYRVRSLLAGAFPELPRPKAAARRAPRPAHARHRSPEQVGAGEIGRLVATLWACAVLACLAWIFLTGWGPLYGIEDPLLFGLWLLAILGGGAVVTGIVLRYRAWARITPEEALVFLQNQTWRESARDQGRLNRWLVWARLRGQARREKS